MTEYLVQRQYKLVMYLLENGAKIRKDFVNDLNMPRTTVYDNLKKLKRKGIIRDLSKPSGKMGRPPTYWQITHNYTLVSFKQSYNVILPKKKKIEKKRIVKKNNKIPNQVISKIISEVKITVPSFKIKRKKNKVKSLILNNRNSKLVQFVLNEVNKCTYFRVPTLRKTYSRYLKNIDIYGKSNQSISGRIGKIIGELRNLGIVVPYSSSTYKNLFKGQIYDVFNEKAEQDYNTKIKLKRIEG